jgi:hypothetical protein
MDKICILDLNELYKTHSSEWKGSFAMNIIFNINSNLLQVGKI